VALLIARHGETALNVARVVQPADTDLSPRGLLQADALGDRLAHEFRVRSIVSSDLPRALRTAERISHRLRVPIDASPLWRERNFGVLRGRAYDSLGFDPLALHAAPEDGESIAQFETRVAQALAAIVLRVQTLAPDEDLLLVTHGLVLRTLLERHIDQHPVRQSGDAADALRAGPLANTALVVAVCTGEGLRRVLGPCAAHLDAAGPAARAVGLI